MEEWISDGEVQLTRGGNGKRASYSDIARWVLDVWQSLDRPLLQRAFTCCGITREGRPDLHRRLHALIHEGEIPEPAEVVEISDPEADDSVDSADSDSEGSNE